MINWNIDLTLYNQQQIEKLLEIAEVMDDAIAKKIVDYLIETYNN